ncbi:MAG: hypothetical protein OEM59_09035 [Rhodospirillales bacterium]|nr:hypothetical protein [Rhodospirillales bacterium]
MQGLDHLEEDDSDTVFRDVIFLALAGFVAIVLLLLPHLNPPAKADEEARSPGNVIVEIRWPDEVNADVDLWVEAPGDVPVGYSNKGGTIFNLLRDDLGLHADFSQMNYEISYSRGIPEGEYTVNLHLYRDLSGKLPIEVSVVVSVKPSPEQAAKQVLATKVPLKVEGEEITAFRFLLDEKARVVTGSVHDLPKALRSKKS